MDWTLSLDSLSLGWVFYLGLPPKLTVRPCGGTLEACSEKTSVKRSAEAARPYGDFTISYSDWEKKEQAKISAKRSAEDIKNNDISDQGNNWSNDECWQTMEKSGIDIKHFPFQTAHRFINCF